MKQLIESAERYVQTPAFLPFKYHFIHNGLCLIINLLLHINKRLDHFEEVIKEEYDYPSEAPK